MGARGGGRAIQGAIDDDWRKELLDETAETEDNWSCIPTVFTVKIRSRCKVERHCRYEGPRMGHCSSLFLFFSLATRNSSEYFAATILCNYVANYHRVIERVCVCQRLELLVALVASPSEG